MCVDFTDLNTAFPRYPHLLPNIENLIDESFDYKTLNFMDAYYGYNQIKMNHIDSPKITFMFNHDNYYYNVMTFWAKEHIFHLSKTRGCCIFKADRAQPRSICQ